MGDPSPSGILYAALPPQGPVSEVAVLTTDETRNCGNPPDMQAYRAARSARRLAQPLPVNA